MFDKMEMLSANIVSGLNDINLKKPTELQQLIIPKALNGHDALIKSTSAKEKYASFAIPVLEAIDAKEEADGIQALILTPSSQAAQQITDIVRAIGYHCDISCASIDNDGDQEEFKHILNNKPEALVGNPDSLLNTLNDHRFIFRQVDYLVIDDANSLIKQNQLPKVEGVLKRILSDYQTLIYADELTEKVKEFSLSTLDDGMSLGFDGTNGQLLGNPPTVEKGLNHSYIYVPNRMKITTLMAHIKEVSKDRYVIFTASKRGTDRLYKTLRKQNYKATSLHGKLSEEKYKQRYNNFMNGDVQFLLVADIPASQLGLKNIGYVINYDVPNDCDEYRYRAHLVESSDSGALVSLVSKQDRSDINKLEGELAHGPKELTLPKKVKEELQRRRNKTKKKRKRSNNGRKRKKKNNDTGLPQPSYEKLSGGKEGSKKKDKKSGVIGMLKNLFS